MKIEKCINEGCEDGRSNGLLTCLQHIPEKGESRPNYEPHLVKGTALKTVIGTSDWIGD